VEGAIEGVENESKIFQGDHAKERGIMGLPQDDWRMSISLRKREMTFGHVSFDRCPVCQGEHFPTFGSKLQSFPHVVRQEGVGGPAIHQEPDGGLFFGGPRHHSLNVCNAHACILSQNLDASD